MKKFFVNLLIASCISIVVCLYLVRLDIRQMIDETCATVILTIVTTALLITIIDHINFHVFPKKEKRG